MVAGQKGRTKEINSGEGRQGKERVGGDRDFQQWGNMKAKSPYQK